MGAAPSGELKGKNMTEKTNTELTDQQKAELAEEAERARAWVRIEQDETVKRTRENDWKRLSSMSDAEFRQFKIENFGFE
jgi:hypothetical protein